MNAEKNVLTNPPNIPVVAQPPADCWLRVLVHGLFIGAFGGEEASPFLETGALYAPPSGHKLDLSLYNREDGKALKSFTDNINHHSIIELQVAEGGILARCGTTEGPGRFDYGWVANFEGPEFYPSKCEKIPEKLGPRLRLHKGVIYTAIRSTPLKKAISGNKTSFRRITQVLAVDISGGTGATLTIDGKALQIAKEKINYNLVFRNDCGLSCSNIPGSGGLSDFNHLFSAFGPPTGGGHTIEIYDDEDYAHCKEHLLKRDLSDLGDSPEDQAKYLRGLEKVFVSEPLSRYDPCGMGFFGDSNGLDHNTVT